MQTPQGTFLSGPNASFIEELYGRYVENPNSVDPSWQTFFAELQDEGRAVLQDLKGASWAPRGGERPSNGNGAGHIKTGNGSGLPLVTDAVGQVAIRASAKDSIRVLMLIRAYRVRGHLEANLDPLGLKPKESHADLNPRRLRLHRRRYGPADLHRQCAGPGCCDVARDTAARARDLLRQYRRRVHAYPGSGAAALDPGPHRGDPQPDPVHRARQARHPGAAHRRGNVRALPRPQIYRHQALRPGWRRDPSSRRWSRS